MCLQGRGRRRGCLGGSEQNAKYHARDDKALIIITLIYYWLVNQRKFVYFLIYHHWNWTSNDAFVSWPSVVPYKHQRSFMIKTKTHCFIMQRPACPVILKKYVPLTGSGNALRVSALRSCSRVRQKHKHLAEETEVQRRIDSRLWSRTLLSPSP